MQSEKQEKRERPEGSVRDAEAGDGKKQVEIHCDNCQGLIEDLAKAISQKALKRGFIEVGVSCPHCNTWFRSYYTTPELEAGRPILARFRDKANRSPEDWQKYQRKRLLFQRKHDQIQAEAKRLFAHRGPLAQPEPVKESA